MENYRQMGTHRGACCALSEGVKGPFQPVGLCGSLFSCFAFSYSTPGCGRYYTAAAPTTWLLVTHVPRAARRPRRLASTLGTWRTTAAPWGPRCHVGGTRSKQHGQADRAAYLAAT